MISKFPLRTLRPSRLLSQPRPLSTLSRAVPSASLSLAHIQSTSSPAPTPTASVSTPISTSIAVQPRPYSNGAASGKSEPDQLVEELQELYEIATDEFEIASEATDNATIYAASDRESARDALNQLLVVYTLYSTDVSSPEFQNVQKEQEQLRQREEEEEEEAADGDQEESKVVTTNFNPAEVSAEAREEVRKRVGQRVRELQNAVETMEEKATED